jgi:hypothetical protein
MLTMVADALKFLGQSRLFGFHGAFRERRFRVSYGKGTEGNGASSLPGGEGIDRAVPVGCS